MCKYNKAGHRHLSTSQIISFRAGRVALRELDPCLLSLALSDVYMGDTGISVALGWGSFEKAPPSFLSSCLLPVGHAASKHDHLGPCPLNPLLFFSAHNQSDSK